MRDRRHLLDVGDAEKPEARRHRQQIAHGRQRVQERDAFGETGGFRAGWCDAYGYALVATGRVEVMLDPIMYPWDGGPFPPILTEAGGYFGDWQGNPTIYGNEGLGTTQTLLLEVLRLLNDN